MKWNEHKWKVLLPLLAAGILVFAYWYGGNAPGAQGWSVSAPPSAAAVPSSWATPPAVSSPPPSPSPTPVMAAAMVSPNPAPTAEPVPSPAVEDAPLVCTLSISCAVLLDGGDAPDGVALPEDGWLLAPTQVVFEEGESAFDVLRRACRDEGVHLEFSTTPLYQSAYIEGIGNLYEFDCGELSGWMYQVNSAFPRLGCSSYGLQDGDVVCWQYTRDLGKDIGAEGALAAQRENSPEA